jgi:hypothetical protein
VYQCFIKKNKLSVATAKDCFQKIEHKGISLYVLTYKVYTCILSVYSLY